MPVASPSRTSCFRVSLSRAGRPRSSFRFCPFEAGLRAFDKQVTFELCRCGEIDHDVGHGKCFVPAHQPFANDAGPVEASNERQPRIGLHGAVAFSQKVRCAERTVTVLSGSAKKSG